MSATLEVDIGLTGLTLTCDLFPDGSDTAAVSAVALTEATNRKGLYTASVSVTGVHKVKLYSGGNYFPAVLWADIPASGTVTTSSDPTVASTVSVVVPASVAAASAAENAISVLRGDTLRRTFNELGNLSSRTKLWMTVKRSTDDADADAILSLTEGDGLLLVNGEAYATDSDGSLTVSSPSNATLVVYLHQAVTAILPLGSYVYDVQFETSTDISTPLTGSFTVTADVTQATE